MDKEKEAKGILEKVFAMLSGIEKKEAVVSEEIKEDVVAEVEMSEQEDSEETIEAAKEEVKEVIEEPVEAELSKEEPTYVTSAELEAFKAELTSVLKEELKSLKVEKEVLQEKVVELSAQPSAEPVVHSPEMSSDSKASFHISENRPQNTLDNIMDKLNNFK